MITPIHARAIALVLATATLAPPLHAQQGAADDPHAAVPDTRYQSAYVQPAPPRESSTPERNWQALNRAVGAPAAEHPQSGHAYHAPPAEPEKSEAQPHHHHEGHHP